MMARQYDRMMAGYELDAGPRRAALLGELSGRVVELGPGTGVNLEHLGCRHAAPTSHGLGPGASGLEHPTEAGPHDLEWFGVEPSEPMRDKLRERWTRERPGSAEPHFVGLDGNRLELEDGWADAVVATLVLCSVPDPAATLAEVRRVLKPGGRFVFLEHVGAPRGTWTRRLQALGTPVWRWLADGCCLNRDTGALIESAGFEAVELEAYVAPREAAPPWVAHHVAGVARR